MPVPPGPGGARHASRGTSLPQLTLCMPSGRASHHPKDNTVSGDGWRSKAVSRLPQLLLILNGSTRRRRQSVSESPEDRRTDNADKEVDERLQQLPCSPYATGARDSRSSPRPHRCDGGGLRAEDLRTLGMQPVLSGGRLVYRTRLNVSPIVCVGPIVAREDLTLLTKALAHIP